MKNQHHLLARLILIALFIGLIYFSAHAHKITAFQQGFLGRHRALSPA